MPVEDFSVLGPPDALALDQYQDQPAQQLQSQETIIGGKRGRKRKLPQPDVTMNVEQSAKRTAAIEEAPAAVSLDAAQLTQSESQLPAPVADMSTMSQHVDNLAASLDGGIARAYTSSNNVTAGMIPGGMTPLGGMTPGGMHGDYLPLDIMTPHHGIDQIESIPNLPLDQVSSILNGPGMDGFSNMGFDDGPMAGPSSGMSERIASDWNENDDYDFPPSVGAHVSHYEFHFDVRQMI